MLHWSCGETTTFPGHFSFRLRAILEDQAVAPEVDVLWQMPCWTIVGHICSTQKLLRYETETEPFSAKRAHAYGHANVQSRIYNYLDLADRVEEIVVLWVKVLKSEVMVQVALTPWLSLTNLPC